jgi:hypothetical protein
VCDIDILDPLDEALLEEEAVQQPESKRYIVHCAMTFVGTISDPKCLRSFTNFNYIRHLPDLDDFCV